MQDHWNSQTILQYFFLPLLPMLYDGVNMLKNNKKKIFNVSNSYKSWIFKWVTGWCVKQIPIYIKIDNYLIIHWPIKINSISTRSVGGETNTCFSRSKSMDLNNFWIRSNALTIRLSRNLVNYWQMICFTCPRDLKSVILFTLRSRAARWKYKTTGKLLLMNVLVLWNCEC